MGELNKNAIRPMCFIEDDTEDQRSLKKYLESWPELDASVNFGGSITPPGEPLESGVNGTYWLSGRELRQVELDLFGTAAVASDEPERPNGFQGEIRQRIHRPPGFRLLGFADFFYSQKAFKEIFQPTVCDLQEEYAAALAAGRIWKAKWVRVRGYWSFARAAGLHSALSIFRQIWKIWRSV